MHRNNTRKLKGGETWWKRNLGVSLKSLKSRKDPPDVDLTEDETADETVDETVDSTTEVQETKKEIEANYGLAKEASIAVTLVVIAQVAAVAGPIQPVLGALSALINIIQLGEKVATFDEEMIGKLRLHLKCCEEYYAKIQKLNYFKDKYKTEKGVDIVIDPEYEETISSLIGELTTFLRKYLPAPPNSDTDATPKKKSKLKKFLKGFKSKLKKLGILLTYDIIMPLISAKLAELLEILFALVLSMEDELVKAKNLDNEYYARIELEAANLNKIVPTLPIAEILANVENECLNAETARAVFENKGIPADQKKEILDGLQIIKATDGREGVKQDEQMAILTGKLDEQIGYQEAEKKTVYGFGSRDEKDSDDDDDEPMTRKPIQRQTNGFGKKESGLFSQAPVQTAVLSQGGRRRWRQRIIPRRTKNRRPRHQKPRQRSKRNRNSH
jgi:hypothetical protein